MTIQRVLQGSVSELTPTPSSGLYGSLISSVAGDHFTDAKEFAEESRQLVTEYLDDLVDLSHIYEIDWDVREWTDIPDGGISGLNAELPIPPSPSVPALRDVLLDFSPPYREEPVITDEPIPAATYGDPNVNIG